MMSNFRSRTLSATSRLVCAFSALAAITAALPLPASALTQSWNGYKWSRTGPLVISLGNNLDASWSSLLQPTATAWSAANNIDFTVTTGRTTASSCGGVYGGVEVCNYNYGANGWLGYANVWLSGGFIVQATVKLNDYYFNLPKYNTAAWRNMTICQEVGHTLGLAHTNVARTDLNTGSCMDYTNDPTGTLGTNGTLANVAPNSVDFAALDGIYANVNTSQLPSTKLQFRVGEGFSIDGTEVDSFMAVPEPQSWTLMIAGFGGIGAAMRRRRSALVTA